MIYGLKISTDLSESFASSYSQVLNRASTEPDEKVFYEKKVYV